MTSITQALTTALFQFVWQGALVAAMLWWILALLRRRSAGLRYIVSCIAMAVLVFLPAVTAYRAYSSPQSAVADLPTLLPAVATIVPAANAKPLPWNWLASLRLWVLPIWLLGVLVCSLRLIWCGRQIAALRRSSEAAADSIREIVEQLAERLCSSRRVQVLISRVVDGPSVIGWIRPIVLVPASSLAGLSPEQLEAVLAHEVAHIRRYDDVVNMFQALVETLLFYHPAVWWTSACIRRERELCCDDLAVQVTGNGIGYARALARLERMRLSSTAMALGAADESLSYRIRRIVGEAGPESSQTNMSGVVALCVCLALAAIAINAGRMHSQGQQPSVTVGKAIMTADGRVEFAVAQSADRRVSFVRDAPGVTVDSGAANVVHRSSVEYPQSARAIGIDGTVTLDVSLDNNGNVTDARVLAGPIELRRACLQSVLQWHFAPDTASATRQIAIRFDSKTAEPADSSERTRLEAKRKAEEQARSSGTEPTKSFSAEKRFTVTTSDGPVTTRLNPEPPQLVEKSTLRILEEQLEKIQKQPTSELNERQAADLKKKLEQARAALRQIGTRAAVAGRVLTNITFSGVSEPSQSALLTRLPVKIGAALTQESIAELVAALQSYDEHLVATFDLSDANEAVLNIAVRQ
jgi:TonB family protein